MSKFTRYATTSQSLSLAAMEEASRRGLRTADLDNLFLALVLDDQSAGRALRNFGVTITSVRAAVEGSDTLARYAPTASRSRSTRSSVGERSNSWRPNTA